MSLGRSGKSREDGRMDKGEGRERYREKSTDFFKCMSKEPSSFFFVALGVDQRATYRVHI